MDEYFTDSKLFFDTIKSYAKEINGTVLMADRCGAQSNGEEIGCYVGFVVYYDNDKNEDEKAKHFLLNAKHLVECDPLIREALKSNVGKQNLAKALSYNGSFAEVFLKPHEGFDKIEVPRGIVNLTIEMLENGERFCKESNEPHGENKYRLLVKALRVALEEHDGIEYLKSQLVVALGVNPEDVGSHPLHEYECKQKLEQYDLLVTTIRNILTDAGIPDHEEYPDEDVDDHEKSLRTGGRMIPLDKRVEMLVERYCNV